MHIRDYLAQRPTKEVTSYPWESDWLDLASIPIRSGKLAVCDPTLFLNDDAIHLPPAEYSVEARIIEYNDDQRISRLRVTSDQEVIRGQIIGMVGVDFAQVGVGDFEAIEAAAEYLDEAGQAAVIASLDAPSLWGIAPWGNQPEAQMPFVKSGFGDGNYAIYELLTSAERTGVEVVFIDLTEA